MRKLIFAVSLVGIALASGCVRGKQYLPVRTASDTFALTAGLTPGTAVGKCVTYSANGLPTISPCPAPVRALLDQTQAFPSGKAIRHNWSIFQFKGNGSIPGYRGAGGLRLAQESLLFDTQEISSWKEDVSDSDFNGLTQLCVSVGSAPFSAIVVREYDGCARSFHDENASLEAPLWGMDIIGMQGINIGGPENFWSDNPSALAPPKNINCNAKQAIEVQVLGLEALCSQRVAPLQVHRLTREIVSLREELIRARQEAERLAAARTLAEARIRELQQETAAIAARGSHTNAELNAALSRLNDANGRLQEANSRVTALQAQLTAANERVTQKIETVEKAVSEIKGVTPKAANPAPTDSGVKQPPNS